MKPGKLKGHKSGKKKWGRWGFFDPQKLGSYVDTKKRKKKQERRGLRHLTRSDAACRSKDNCWGVQEIFFP